MNGPKSQKDKLDLVNLSVYLVMSFSSSEGHGCKNHRNEKTVSTPHATGRTTIFRRKNRGGECLSWCRSGCVCKSKQWGTLQDLVFSIPCVIGNDVSHPKTGTEFIWTYNCQTVLGNLINAGVWGEKDHPSFPR